MLKTQFMSALLFASVFGAGTAHADPFDPRLVPAESKWVIHADVDAARDSKTFEAAWDRLLANGQAKFDQIEEITGMNIPNDIHDLTLFGKEAGDEAGVILIHGKIDRNKTLEHLQFAKQFTNTPYGSYEMLSWFDEDKKATMFGAFHDADRVIIGRVEKNIELALDTIDGKSPSIKADSPMLSGVKPQLLAYVAASEVQKLHGKGEKSNPVLATVESAWISVSEKDDLVTLRAELTSSSADTAADIKDSLDGLRGMIGIAARNQDDPNPVAKALVAAARSFAATQKDAKVSIEWPIPIEQVQGIINAIAAKQAAK